MRRVNFVRSLNVDSIPMLNGDEVRYQSMESITPVPSGDDIEFLLTEKTIEVRIAPVHTLSEGHADGRRDDTYIAYSKEVQDLLRMPFDTMKRQLDDQSKQISNLYSDKAAVREASLWTRVKFVFSGDMRTFKF